MCAHVCMCVWVIILYVVCVLLLNCVSPCCPDLEITETRILPQSWSAPPFLPTRDFRCTTPCWACFYSFSFFWDRFSQWLSDFYHIILHKIYKLVIKQCVAQQNVRYPSSCAASASLCQLDEQDSVLLKQQTAQAFLIFSPISVCAAAHSSELRILSLLYFLYQWSCATLHDVK